MTARPKIIVRVIRFLLLTALVLIGCMVAIFLSFGGSIRFDCTERNNSEPQAPIYPDAAFVSRTVDLDSDHAESLMYTYASQDTLSQLGDFYTAAAGCFVDKEFNRILCSGDAQPFGKYQIMIRPNEQSGSEISINVYWDKCGPGVATSIE